MAKKGSKATAKNLRGRVAVKASDNSSRNGQKQLAEALAGQRLCIAGTIELAGQPLQHLGVAARQKQGLRYLSDDRLGEAGVAHYPIALNLLLKRIGDAPFWHHGIERREQMEAHAVRLISRHEIRTRGPHTPLGQLSGGNVQKVLLARVLSRDPRVVVVSQPTRGLDIGATEYVRSELLARREAGAAVLLVSEDLDELLALSDRLIVMYEGRIVGEMRAGDADPDRLGLLMAACVDTDGDVLGELLPRRPPIPPRPGLAWVIGAGQRWLVQVGRERSGRAGSRICDAPRPEA